MDRYEILGLSSILIFGFTTFYHIFVGIPADAFYLCNLSLIFLGLGLVAQHRLLFSIGTFLVLFPLITIFFLIIGVLIKDPYTLNQGPSWIVIGISTHIFSVLTSILGYKKKFRYFHRSSWWITTCLMVSIWFTTFFLNTSEYNINWTLNPPPLLEFMGLWGFAILTLILTTSFWFILNYRYSKPNQNQ
ncbi:MAG: hypothetical protein HWN66_18180 [Candidatus Helarchaeota archaeon]|nr:hypothetical protein [Candidatus Helarchaeota archaeon]